MYRIVNEAEGWIKRQRDVEFAKNGQLILHNPVVPSVTSNHLDGMASAVVRASRSLNAKCIVVLSKTGNTAINIAKFYPDIPIVTLIPSQKVGRFLQLYRGIHPVLAHKDLSNPADLSRFTVAIEAAKNLGFCKVDDTVIIVGYEEPIDQLSSAVSMRVAKVVESSPR